jgi:hypothetical protein
MGTNPRASRARELIWKHIWSVGTHPDICPKCEKHYGNISESGKRVMDYIETKPK